MRKIILSLFALLAVFAASAQNSASNDKVSVSNLALSVADGEKIDEDGDFKVTLTYAVSIIDPAIADHKSFVSNVAEYEVTDAAGNSIATKKETLSSSATSRNFYISGLEAGQEYTMTLKNFFVIDRSNADYETNWGDTLMVISNGAEVKFTPAAGETKPVDIKNMSITYDKGELIDSDGDYMVTFNYTGVINDNTIKPADLFSIIKYQVYDDAYNYIDGGNRDFDLVNETSRNIYIANLKPGKTYTIMVTGLVVNNGTTEILNLTSGLPKLPFKVKDPNAPQAITMNEMSFSVANGEKIDEDGDFKITFNYKATVNDPSAITSAYSTFSYEITDSKGEKVTSSLKDFDYTAPSKNFYVSGLMDGETYTVKATNITIQDLGSMDVLCEMEKDLPSLTFTVGASVAIDGDANNDGAVSVADLALMASYILGEKVDINITNADVNKDNAITVADLAAVASMILGAE